MRGIDRFLWAVKGVRWLPSDSEAREQREEGRAYDEQFIRGEAARRLSEDLGEAIRQGDKKAKKKRGVVTTSDGPRVHLFDDPAPVFRSEPAVLSLRERWRRLWGKGRAGT